MGRRTIKRRGRPVGRPSTFFLVVLAIGVIALMVVFFMNLHRAVH